MRVVFLNKWFLNLFPIFSLRPPLVLTKCALLIFTTNYSIRIDTLMLNLNDITWLHCKRKSWIKDRFWVHKCFLNFYIKGIYTFYCLPTSRTSWSIYHSKLPNHDSKKVLTLHRPLECRIHNSFTSFVSPRN